MTTRAPDKVEQPIASAVAALGYELVGVECLPQGRHSVVRVYIDAPAGITLDDCERASHQISGVLDVEDPIKGQYILEVSSPGLDRPLFTAEHFNRFAGAKVKLRLTRARDGRRQFTGVLLGMRGGDVAMKLDDGELCVPLGEVERARLVPEY
ncbi:MAG TPA: ribosome maturation factor RimP [Gammaproteobacteria bacterium]|nr:ribosome maturation factor RimP [Gammaproteobacteria bacterium]